MNKDLTDHQTIRDRLMRAEQHLGDLLTEQKKTESTIQSLKKELAAVSGREDSARFSPSVSTTLLSPDEKIQIFRQLFRGRDDVYPKLWTNNKTGKKGYSPACTKEWVRGVCEKPRVKCGECTRQAFESITNNVTRDHLQGRHTMGIYPMLLDDTCWFLAADFDKQDWQKDVTAFAETCRNYKIPYAIERSRSGNGAHVWIFFTSPVLASAARKMGTFLITETMASRHQLSMSSYDRLFPNQDTLPKGGFGNLIALPLQFHPRKAGHTVFLDDELKPLPDQWLFLSRMKQISVADVEMIANNTNTQEGIIDPEITSATENTTKPWIRSSSHKLASMINSEAIPEQIHVALSQRVFIEIKGLPSPLINQIKRLAIFQNPEFYKKQSLRLSTALTPRIISCAEMHKEHISLPRGCLENIDILLQECGSQLNLEDLRNRGKPLGINFHGQLTKAQKKAVRTAMKHDTGVIVAPPGFGKTVLGTYLIAKRNCNTLVLVHRQPLLEQWISQISIFLDVDAKSIGQIGGGKRKPTGNIDVAMIQSLTTKESVDNIVSNYGQVIIDECHHLPAVSFERLLSEVTARYVVGLTATPQRRDGLHPIMHMQIGPVRFKTSSLKLAAVRGFRHILVTRETTFSLPDQSSDISIQELYSQLAQNEERNNLIVNDVLLAIEEGRSPILLTERKDHLEYLHERLKNFVRHIVVLKGGRSTKERRAVQKQLETIPPDEERVLLATGRYIGEGFDDARLDTLFLALPVSWKGTLIQYAGRLHRSHPGKKEVRIVDYIDNEVPTLARMFDKRTRGYRAMGYKGEDKQ